MHLPFFSPPSLSAFGAWRNGTKAEQGLHMDPPFVAFDPINHWLAVVCWFCSLSSGGGEACLPLFIEAGLLYRRQGTESVQAGKNRSMLRARTGQDFWEIRAEASYRISVFLFLSFLIRERRTWSCSNWSTTTGRHALLLEQLIGRTKHTPSMALLPDKPRTSSLQRTRKFPTIRVIECHHWIKKPMDNRGSRQEIFR